MKERIQKQKKLAFSVLEKLKELGFFAVVAGGAPRDWFFNRPAKDIDIFVQNIETSLTSAAIVKIFDETGWNLYSKIFEDYSDLMKKEQASKISKDYIKANLEITKVSLGDSNFTNNKFVVCSFIIDDEEVQLIFRDFQSNPATLVKSFGCTISEAYFSENNKAVYSEHFYESLKRGIIFYSEKTGYILKMFNKFNNWGFVQNVSYFV